MTGPRIRVENGTGYALGICSACPSWRPLGADQAEVLRAGAVHIDLCHGDPVAAKSIRGRAARYADTPPRQVR